MKKITKFQDLRGKKAFFALNQDGFIKRLIKYMKLRAKPRGITTREILESPTTDAVYLYIIKIGVKPEWQWKCLYSGIPGKCPDRLLDLKTDGQHDLYVRQDKPEKSRELATYVF
jgi:hypothetical protein